MTSLKNAGVLAILALTACGSDKPPAKSATAHGTGDTAAMATPPKAATTESKLADDRSGTGVSLDDAIMKACGISAAEAHFAFDSSRVESGDATPLAKVASCFISGPLKGRTLSLVGRADPRGGSEYNVALGQSRADAVGRYLMSKGLARGQVSSTSRGSLDASGSDEGGWAKDRRVDLLLMK